MATHSSTLAWKIPWTEEPGGLQSMGSLRVRHDWATSLSLFTFTFHFHFSLSCIGEGNGNPLQYSCLEDPRDGGAWWAAIYGVAQSRTWLMWLNSSSSSSKTFIYCLLMKGTWWTWPPFHPSTVFLGKLYSSHITDKITILWKREDDLSKMELTPS